MIKYISIHLIVLFEKYTPVAALSAINLKLEHRVY